jgi:SAM-dependent methyltransferase
LSLFLQENDMSLATTHIPDWARNLLSGAIIADNTVNIGDVDKDQFQTMHRIILAMGGRWSPVVSCFTFPMKADVEALIRNALRGEQPPAPPPNPAGRWDTPPELAWEIISQARITRGTTVLDMCAGSGHLTGLAIAAGAKVYAVEEDATCVTYLRERMKGLKKLWHREPGVWFCEMRPYLADRYDDAGELKPKLQFQAVVMHSAHAWLLDLGLTCALWPFVAPGGMLATVISAENYEGEQERAMKFRLWCDEIGADMAPVSDRMHYDYGEVNDAILFVGEKDDA